MVDPTKLISSAEFDAERGELSVRFSTSQVLIILGIVVVLVGGTLLAVMRTTDNLSAEIRALASSVDQLTAITSSQALELKQVGQQTTRNDERLKSLERRRE